MKGIEFRLNDFLPPGNRRALIADVSAGMVLGHLPGLEDFSTAVTPMLTCLDGLVCGPGQLRRLSGATRQSAGRLVRVDWTNTLRGAGFILPPAHPMAFPLFTAQDALDFGAAGMVISFLLGYEEEIEAACLKTTVSLALDGKAIGLPLVVEVRPDGPRVSLPGKAVELGVSYALEGGADVVVLPNPGPASLKTIAAFSSIPWLVKPRSLETAAAELEEVLALGGAGLWLDQALFALPDPPAFARQLHDRLLTAPLVTAPLPQA